MIDALPCVGARVGSAGPLSVLHIQDRVESTRKLWKSMPKVVVVQSVTELPFPANASVNGGYSEGEVFLVADNFADERELEKVLAHECVMHHGLEQILGNYGYAKLNAGIQQLKKGHDPVILRLSQTIHARYGDLLPLTETKEIVALAGEECVNDEGNIEVQFGFMKSVFADVASWLRDIGFQVPFTHCEMQGIMQTASSWIFRDPQLGGCALAGEKVIAAPVGLREGVYLGPVLSVDGDFVRQSCGRGSIIDHCQASLSRPVVLGEVITIEYVSGVGVVSAVVGQSKSVSR